MILYFLDMLLLVWYGHMKKKGHFLFCSCDSKRALSRVSINPSRVSGQSLRLMRWVQDDPVGTTSKSGKDSRTKWVLKHSTPVHEAVQDATSQQTQEVNAGRV